MVPEMPVKSETISIASTHSRGQDVNCRIEKPETEPVILSQPETRRISHDQLVREVKGIYAGLVMVEAKCIDMDKRQSAAAMEKDVSKSPQIENDQWQSLIALHKKLLHEHHDFFLASRHPAASAALRRLAAKYSMPARMWRHGIHTFLEILRHKLPDSLEHMLAFIYIAYSMMALLYETVPTFGDTWIEGLGDLGRYRMAIEDDEPRNRETWSNVARFWYNKAADKSPTVGKLYHHLAILARPYSLEQLSLYTRALAYITPFESARGSVISHFKPIPYGTDAVNRRSSSSSLDTVFIRAYGYLFTMHHAGDDHQFVRAACKTGSSLAVTFTICASLVVPATARTIPRNTSNEESTGSFTAVVIPLAHWPYLAFVIITLLVAQYLAHIKDPIFIWGCMMTVWAFGWWTIRADSSTSLQISAV